MVNISEKGGFFMSKKYIILIVTFFISLFLIGCNSSVGGTVNVFSNDSTVGQFLSYDSLKTYLDETYKSSTYYNYYYRSGVVFSDALLGAEATYTSTTSDTSTTSSVEYSESNDQVDGVSESDTILTDGVYIYVISGSNFYQVNADTFEIENQLTCENGSYTGMYLTDTHVVLLSSIYYHVTDEILNITDYYYGLQMQSYALSDFSLTKTVYFDQTWLVESRMIGDTLYLVMQNYQYNGDDSTDYLIPQYSDSTDDNGMRYIGLDHIYFTPVHSSYSISYIILATMDVTNTEKANVDAYLANSYQIYMSLNNMYLVSYQYDYNEEDDSYSEHTFILRYEIQDNQLVYKAVAMLSGYPLSQYSLDETDGVFRIATTDYQYSYNGNSYYDNSLYLFDATSEGVMDSLSVLSGLGKDNERIYAVRYDGDTAYVVTFVNTDPLYKIDLSDPYNPEVLGELYEDGVSDYLHMMGNDLMLGVGRTAETTEYRTVFTGVKVALYDVSGDTPVTLETYQVDSTYSYTPVTYDPKAFVSFDPSNEDFTYVIIPISEYTYIEDSEENSYSYAYLQSAYVFKVYDSGDLEFVSKVSQSSLTDEGDGTYYASWYNTIERSVIIGSTLYTVSYSSIQAFDMNNDFSAVGNVEMDHDYYYRYYYYGTLID